MKNLTKILVSFCFVLLAFSAAYSATVTVGSACGAPGSADIIIPVSLTSGSGKQVAGVNFDLVYDATRLTYKSAAIGQATGSRGKSLYTSNPSVNTLRCIIIGLDGGTIPRGVLVNVKFDIKAGAPGGAANLKLSNLSATDLKGNKIATKGIGSSIKVTAAKRKPQEH